MCEGEFALISPSGTGKSSAIIDAGRKHFVVFVQASLPTGGPSAQDPNKSARLSREFDKEFATMVEDLRRVRDLRIELADVRRANYEAARVRGKQELVARLVQLVRMHVDLTDTITPWDFMVQQLAGPQGFIGNVLEAVKAWGERDLNAVASLIKEQLTPILNDKRRLVVAFDEVDFGLSIDAEAFQREAGKLRGKGILAPFAAAAGEVQTFVGWQIVFAGTGTTEEKVQSLKTGVGKHREANVISAPSLFPTCAAHDVERLLRRLQLTEEEKEALVDLESRSLHGAVPAARTLRDELELYVVGGRFRLLCGVLESVGEAMMERGLGENLGVSLLHRAVQICVNRHRMGLVDMFKMRLDNKSPVYLGDDMLTYLRQVHVAVTMFGRSAFLRSAAPSWSVGDLVALGVAVGGYGFGVPIPGQVEKREFKYDVRERFVLESIDAFFKDDVVQGKAAAASFRNSVELLERVLKSLGAAAQSKGNLVELAILKRLEVLGASGRFPTVADLPFFPIQDRASTETPSPWRLVPFAARALQSSVDHANVPEFLASDDAVGVVFSPDAQCRPDGVLMLPLREGDRAHRRALVVGVAVYSTAVTSAKVTDQFSSTDLSRAYLGANGAVYDAVRSKRVAWFARGLHRTIAVRVHVSLPVAASAPLAAQTYVREKTEAGNGQRVLLRTAGVSMEAGGVGGAATTARTTTGAAVSDGPVTRRQSQAQPAPDDLVPEDVERDVIINLDKSNIHLLLGKPGEDADVDALYELLKFATRDAVGWGGAAATAAAAAAGP